MVNARHPLEPAAVDPESASTTVKEFEVVDEGGFRTTIYLVLIGREWASVYSLVDAGNVDGVEVELLDNDSAVGVPWRRWLRVKAPVGTPFIKRTRTPNPERARIDMETVPHDIEEVDLVLCRRGDLLPPHVVAAESRRQETVRTERPASPVEVQQTIDAIRALLETR